MNQEKATFLTEELRVRNKEIEEIYFKILKEIAELSKSFPDPKLRVRIEIDLKHYPRTENEVFELLTPYVYLLLMKSDEGQLRISYAINDNAVACLGQLDNLTVNSFNDSSIPVINVGVFTPPILVVIM